MNNLNILLPWSKPYLQKVWVADGAMFVRYVVGNINAHIQVWQSVKGYKNIDIEKNWIYQAFGVDPNNTLDGWKNPVSKSTALRIVDEWLVENGWKLLEPDSKLLTLV